MIGDALGLGETLGLELGLGEGELDDETLGRGDAAAGEGVSVISTGVSEGSGPAVVGSAYEIRPLVSSITPIAVSSAGITR
jgi:hypothetical protein